VIALLCLVFAVLELAFADAFGLYLPLLPPITTHVLLLGAMIRWVEVLTSGSSRARWASLLILLSGSLIRFHKPVVVVVAVSFSLVALILLLRRVRGPAWWPKRRIMLTRLALVILAIGVLFLLINAATSNRLWRTYQFLFARRILREGSQVGFDGGRLALWRQAWDVFLERPLFGHGFGVRVQTEWSEDAAMHNLFMFWLVSTGVVGSLVALFLLFFAARHVLRHTDLSEDFVLKMGLLGYCMVLFVFNMIGVTFAEPALTYMTGVVMGLVLKIATLDAEVQRSRGAEVQGCKGAGEQR